MEQAMRIKEVYCNETENTRFGDSGWYEPWTEDRGKLFRSYQQEFGGCVSMMYRDVRLSREATVVAFGVTVVIPARWRIDTCGWVFSRRMRYEDARPVTNGQGRRVFRESDYYTRVVWVEGEDAPAEWGWEGAAP
jgi:hypothetical protein